MDRTDLLLILLFVVAMAVVDVYFARAYEQVWHRRLKRRYYFFALGLMFWAMRAPQTWEH